MAQCKIDYRNVPCRIIECTKSLNVTNGSRRNAISLALNDIITRNLVIYCDNIKDLIAFYNNIYR